MKFNVLDRYTKTISVIFCILAWLLYGGIYLTARLNGINLWNEFAEAGVGAIIILLLMIIALILSTTILLPLCFTHVQISEGEVRLCLGKIKLNKLNWNQIKRIEIFEERNYYGFTRLIINVLVIDQETKMSKRHTSAPNCGRKRITFLYNKDALPLLQQYCQCRIHGLSLAEEYNKQSEKFWQK